MSKYKIVFADYYYADLNAEMEELKALGEDVEILDLTKIVPGGVKDPRKLIEYAKDADAIIVQFATIDAEFINALEKCKVIARYAIGVDTIDLNAAKQKGIRVANVPDYCVDEVADTAAAHILNAARKISSTRDMLLNGDFEMNRAGSIFRLEESTLGLLGFGNVARNLYKKMRGFFKRVVAYDPYFKDTASYPDVEFKSLDDVLRESDVVSIHVPLSDATRGMISGEQFALMKKRAIIVNTARGGLIDEAAMVDALNSSKIAFCGLDVICGENFEHSVLLHHPRIALSPHVAWRSEEAQAELQRKVARNVVSALLTGDPIYSVV